MLENIAKLSNAKSRSISAENITGEKGKGGMDVPTQDAEGNWQGGAGAACARDLGRGWKVSPCVRLEPGELYTLGNIEGPGTIQQIWMTLACPTMRFGILRIYWDDQEHPSVECPVSDFFASAFTERKAFAQISSLPVCVNPGNAFNSYWPMPFRKRCRMTIENIHPTEKMTCYYQINYELDDVPEDVAYFHAQFRRVNPLPYKKVYTILEGVQGKGHYVGTYMAWGMNNNGWWGEGEIKFYMDGDIPKGKTVDEAVAEHGGDCFPTICGTGTEDYFCGSYGFHDPVEKQYREFTTPHAGVPHIVRPDGLNSANVRFSMYRWHLADPIRFNSDIQVTMQAIGWREGGRYLPLQDDIASVAYWYQTLPTAPFPQLPDNDGLEII